MTPTEPRAAHFPGLDEAGRRRLLWLEEHPQAPRFNHTGVDRLSGEGRRRASAFETQIAEQPPAWQPDQAPDWLADYAAWCFREVPFYRRYGPLPQDFFDIPLSERADLSQAPWDFVPDSQPLDGLIVYQTSGATGHPLNILTHPDVLALYLPLLQAALAGQGVAFAAARADTPDRPHVAAALVCHQSSTYTYASVLAYLDYAGFVKVNLNPADWRDPSDRVRFLDDCQPDIYTGDPVSLAELAGLPLRWRPAALVSTAMTLLPGVRQRLAGRFECPILDLYSLNEAGPVAAAQANGHAWELLQPRLLAEILDAEGAPCQPGARGEVVLTGGFNPFLPLLRYRTGDWAALGYSRGGRPHLLDLEGRPPVVFRAADGRRINSIDVTGALKRFALPQFQLHQAADGSLTLRVPAGTPGREQLRAALAVMFGANRPLHVTDLPLPGVGKFLQYTSELAVK